MMLPLLLLLAGSAGPVQDDQPVIRIQLNREEFARGDRARVYVEAQRDGYLVVLHADPDGRVRVLFPLDPTDDDFVRGARRLELRGRSDRDAFLVDDDDGSGVVLAAYAPDPLRYDGFVRNGHWDYRALVATPARSPQDDALAGLLEIVQRMAGDSSFDYDAVTYLVGSGRRAASRYGSGSAYGYGYGAPYGFRLGFSFGYPYRYRHLYGRFYDPFYYDPFCYDAFWGVPECYGYGFGFGYPRQYGYGRPFLGGGFGSRSDGPRFVIPRDRERVTGIGPRPRGSDRLSVTRGGNTRDSRSVQPRGREPRGPSIAPRGGRQDGGRRTPAVSRGRLGGSGSRPSVSGGRGAWGGSSPAARPATRPSGGGRRRG